MLESENIQSFLQLTGEMMQAWVVIPDSQTESRFPDHKQFVHLSTICNMLIKDRMRKYWSCGLEEGMTVPAIWEGMAHTYKVHGSRRRS